MGYHGAMKPLSSRHHPLVALCRALARGRAGGDARLLLDGAHLVGEAVRSSLPVDTAAFTARMLATEEGERLAATLESAGTELVQVTDAVMNAMSPVASPAGLVAVAQRPAGSLAGIVARSPTMVVAAFDVQEPGNAGAIVRAAEAFGASGALFGGASADPFGWKALRGSMGSAFRVPIAARAAAADVLEAARRHGVRLAATVPRGGQAPRDTDLRGPIVFLLGGEGPGLSPALIDAADVRLTIPMREPVESLNVAVATSLLLYEASNQRSAT
jgi:RNA methyltransferase, TrmH family